MRVLLTVIAALLGIWIAFQIAALIISLLMVQEVRHQAEDSLRRIEKEMRR